jgi:hypothetical protein
MSSHLLRLGAARSATLLAAGLLAGCGGATASMVHVTLPTSGRVTRARAIAYAHTVNLRAGDVPGMTVVVPGGEVTAPTRAAAEFASCSGGVNPALRIIKLQSPVFSAGDPRQAQTLESTVEVWPTAAVAARNNAAYLSSRGRACFARSLEALHNHVNKQHPGQLQYGPLTVTIVASPLPGVSHSFLRTIAYPLIRGGRTRLYVYHDNFWFIAGPAEVEMDATGFSKPVPTRTEERLLLLLLHRAKAKNL